MSGVKSEPLSVEKLNAALLDAFDLMARGQLDTLFIVLGKAAKDMKEELTLEADGIDIGVEKRYIDKTIKDMLHVYTGAVIRDDGFEYEFEGVPVRCKFITKEYEFFKFADTAFYGPERYKIPNHFDAYWKMRGMIQ